MKQLPHHGPARDGKSKNKWQLLASKPKCKHLLCDYVTVGYMTHSLDKVLSLPQPALPLGGVEEQYILVSGRSPLPPQASAAHPDLRGWRGKCGPLWISKKGHQPRWAGYLLSSNRQTKALF